jgi:hypothetical protein
MTLCREDFQVYQTTHNNSRSFMAGVEGPWNGKKFITSSAGHEIKVPPDQQKRGHGYSAYYG